MTPEPTHLQRLALGRRTFLGASLAAATVATAAACGFDGGGSGSTGDDGDGTGGGGKGTLKQSMLPVTHLDPAIAGNSSFGQIMMIGLWEGLVSINPDNPSEVLPGVAESWKVSDDGLTYTFTLRDGAKWSNGDPVTAKDFEWNFKRGLTPGIAGQGTPSHPVVLKIVGALDYMTGVSTDYAKVGAKALDDKTFEITMEQANPDLILEVAQYWALPLHPATVEAKGDAWLTPDGWVSNGAYVLNDFRVNQGAVLLPNDQYWDAGNYHLGRWEVTFNDGGTTADLLAYQQGEIHITGRIEDDLEAVTTSDVAAELVSSPTNQIRQLNVMASHNPVLNDIRVRHALAIAIDREALGSIGKPAIGGASLVPQAVPDYDKVSQMAFDVDQAKSLLADAGYADGKGMPTISLLDFQNSPWVQAIAEMWRKNLGINVALDIVESGVYTEKRAQVHDKNYTGFFVNNVALTPPTLFRKSLASIPTAPSYFASCLLPPDVAEEMKKATDAKATPDEKWKIAEGHLYPEWQKAVDLSTAAVAEKDPAKQQAALIDAASAWNETYMVIPVLWGGYNLLIKPTVKNLKPWMYSSVFSTRGVTVEG